MNEKDRAMDLLIESRKLVRYLTAPENYTFLPRDRRDVLVAKANRRMMRRYDRVFEIIFGVRAEASA